MRAFLVNGPILTCPPVGGLSTASSAKRARPCPKQSADLPFPCRCQTPPGLLPTISHGNVYVLLITDRFSRRADMCTATAVAQFTALGTVVIIIDRYILRWEKSCTPSSTRCKRVPRLFQIFHQHPWPGTHFFRHTYPGSAGTRVPGYPDNTRLPGYPSNMKSCLRA